MHKKIRSTQPPAAQAAPSRSPRRRGHALGRASLALLAGCSLLASAAEAPGTVPAAAPAPAPFVADQTYTFKQLGAQYPLNPVSYTHLVMPVVRLFDLDIAAVSFDEAVEGLAQAAVRRDGRALSLIHI